MLVNDVYEEKILRQIFLLWLNIHYYEVGRIGHFLAWRAFCILLQLTYRRVAFLQLLYGWVGVIVCASSVSAWHSPMTVSVFLLLTLNGNLWCGKEGTRSIPKHQSSLSTNETESQHFIHLNTQLQVISTSGKTLWQDEKIFLGSGASIYSSESN